LRHKYSKEDAYNLYNWIVYKQESKAKEKESVTDLEILVVLVTRLLRQDLDRLIKGMEPVKL
jgi:hypothetical protein